MPLVGVDVGSILLRLTGSAVHSNKPKLKRNMTFLNIFRRAVIKLHIFKNDCVFDENYIHVHGLKYSQSTMLF